MSLQARPYVSGAVIGLFLQDCPVRPRDPDDPVAAVIEIAGSLSIVPCRVVLLRAHRLYDPVIAVVEQARRVPTFVCQMYRMSVFICIFLYIFYTTHTIY